MKKSYILAALVAPGFAFAQSGTSGSGEDLQVKIVEYKDSTDAFITMHENAPKKGNIKDVPRFTLYGKNGKFYMGVGANVKAVGVYDFGNPISTPNLFTTSAIPMSVAPGNGAEFKFNAQQSNIYMNVVALPGSENQVGAYVSVNFLGDGYNPMLQHAYLKYRGITAGYTFSLFSDAAATPSTIDYEGPNAFTGVIHGNIYYEKPFGKHNEWKAGVGLDVPANSYTNAERTVTVSQRVPDIPFYIQRSWAGGAGWLRVSGIVRNLYYRNEEAGKNIDKVGWGVKASGMTPIVGGLTGYYQAVYGKGIASYIQDLTGCGMDLMPSQDAPGVLDPVKAWAGFGALQYNFSPSVYCTAIYSHVRTYAHPYSSTSSPWGASYKYAQYILGNVFWDVNSIVQVGVEYIYGRRVDYSGAQAHDNRIEAMIQVSF